MKPAVVSIALALAVAAAWYAWPQASHQQAVRRAARPAPPAASDITAPQLQWFSEVPGDGGARPAWQSMAEAREAGDSRAPPIAPSAPVAGATAAQLADPKAYRDYENGQHARVLAAFAAAAQAEAPRLRADVERARAEGIDSGQIARIEAKIRRLEQASSDIIARGAAP